MVQEIETVVTITDKAAEKAKALLADRGVEDAALRVFVVGGGCSGYQYGMAIAQGKEEDDIVIEHSGVTVLVDPE
ncbi:MAG: iron-sulfur cluster assembly accessory protein, partial [Dehalococcoidia bacterium]